MPQIIAALASGLLFGVGLTLSRMIDPAKVLTFLDVSGDWDASLAFVLLGASGTTAVGFQLIFARRSTALFADSFSLPRAREID